MANRFAGRRLDGYHSSCAPFGSYSRAMNHFDRSRPMLRSQVGFLMWVEHKVFKREALGQREQELIERVNIRG